ERDPGRARSGRACELAFGAHEAREPRRRDAKRERRVAAEDVDARVDRGDVAQDLRVELDVLERLPGTGKGRLTLGRPVGVVERRPQCPPPREGAKIVDGEG